jgi:thiamine biosynthesis lipoprotein
MLSFGSVLQGIAAGPAVEADQSSGACLIVTKASQDSIALVSSQSQNRRGFLSSVIPARTPENTSWLHVSRMAMACRFEVTLPPSEPAAVPVASEALDEIDSLEAQLSTFRESSEVSYVNRNAAAGPVRVSSTLFNLLSLSQDLSRATGGSFDITSAPLTRCWGFLHRAGRLPDPREIEKTRALVGFNKLELDGQSRTIRFAHPGVEINFGSIGKGYALDCAASLIKHRVQSALLNAGASSMRAIGAGATGQQGWVIGLRNPLSTSSRLGVVRIRDSALSTSGSEEQFFVHEGKRYGHIVDPRSGWPASCVTTVTVVASSAAVSDALATAFYVGGRELAERYCEANPEVLVAMLESGAATPIVLGSNRYCDGPTQF